MAKKQINIGVLALQGAFREHIQTLQRLGVNTFEIRQLRDLNNQKIDGLILPGGESTVQGKLLKELKLYEPIKKLIEEGLPVLATCAGSILLAQQISDEEQSHLGTLPVEIKRNAYGRQLGSFITKGKFKDFEDVQMNFIRAPYFERTLDEKVKVLSSVDDKVVAVQYENQLALSFHPEVGKDTRIHEYFIGLVG